jgi:spore germination protein GerM
MKNKFTLAIALIAAALVGRSIAFASRSFAARTQTVKVYLVDLEDNGKRGRKIGCGDSLVSVKRTITSTRTPLRAALNELLSIPPTYKHDARLTNYWKGRNLRVRDVSIRNGTATIHLTGEVFVAGICDEPRIENQIRATALQFPSVKRVKVFIGNRSLRDAIR